MIENPYTKNAQFGSLALTNQQSSSLTMRTMPRSPLIAMTPNRDNLKQQKTKPMATPGPPPKMSLSLMGGLTTPMQMKTTNLKQPQMKQQEQRLESLKAPQAVSTPMPVASPRLFGNKKSTDNYFAESTAIYSSESLVADHWVVAHGYTSSNEYKELLGILSSFGTIQNQEAGGNWLAVQYESRLSAEKALSRQSVLLGNTLCGMTRGTPTLMQSLSSGKGGHQQRNYVVPGEAKSTEEVRKGGKTAADTKGKLGEKDILLLENSAYESGEPFQRKSMCDKVLGWYFGWDEHPHSD
eukprot:CAMPEP_0168186296 /NCGR_PEP_ID=MMETSP0139_2-20121125/14346_1 /TAXON_ID=44445 /ORGANISM="Pseudo-nitzschia australis, Strain 10249 10 AB" /LENGTH=295 /DNA_ID=CAMNT_0008108273 /DNA_START=169 /DNA_END=1056 /DNA_ORIENTATION=-